MAVQISGNDITVPRDTTVTRNLTVGGVLTYEDVTNVDSIGIVTARAGVLVGSGITLSKDGDIFATGVTTSTTFSGNFSGGTVSGTTGTFSSDVSVGGELQIADYIVHTGDGDTAIRFPSADTIQFETGGVTRATVNGNNINFPDAGTLRFGASNDLQIYHGTGGASNIIHSNTSQPLIINASGAGAIRLDTNSTERLRINSDGKVLIGDDTAENTIGLNARVQTFGTDASTSGVAIRRGSNDAQAAFLVMSKSRNASVGSRTIVNNGDEVGNIFFAADDGTDLVSNTAAIKSQVDGAPGANDTPGNLSFWTTPDGSNSATQKLTISNAGLMTVTKQYFLVVDRSSHLTGYNATGTTHIVFNRIAQENKDASLASCFNTSNGLFTAPIAGLYFLEAAVYSTDANFGQSWFVVAGARKSFTDEVMTNAARFTHNQTILRLAANETVGYLAYDSSGSNVNIQANPNHTYMKIALIC